MAAAWSTSTARCPRRLAKGPSTALFPIGIAAAFFNHREPCAGPPGNSFGCCTAIGLPGSADFIGSLPGNQASADCSAWIAVGATLPISVWDYAARSGSNAYYHIFGFTGFQITACHGGKDIEGVWRQPVYVGPTTPIPGFAGAALAGQLVQ